MARLRARAGKHAGTVKTRADGRVTPGPPTTPKADARSDGRRVTPFLFRFKKPRWTCSNAIAARKSRS